jgi:hypothetical protein
MTGHGTTVIILSLIAKEIKKRAKMAMILDAVLRRIFFERPMKLNQYIKSVHFVCTNSFQI